MYIYIEGEYEISLRLGGIVDRRDNFIFERPSPILKLTRQRNFREYISCDDDATISRTLYRFRKIFLIKSKIYRINERVTVLRQKTSQFIFITPTRSE